MTRTLICLALFLTFVGCSSEEPAGSGSIDGVDLGLNLELHLENLTAADAPSADDFDRVRTLVTSGISPLDSIRFYSADAMGDEDFESFRIATFPLSGELEGGMAAVAVSDDGFVRKFRIWDVSDERADWENFWRQFEYKDTRGTIDWASVSSDSSAADYTARLAQSEILDDILLRSAYRHTVLMRDNSQTVRTTMAYLSSDKTPGPEFYNRFVENLNELDAIAESYESVIGTSAVNEYKNVIGEGISALEALTEMAQNDNVSGIRNAVSGYRRRTCGACHGISEHNLGEGDLDDRMLEYFTTQGLNRDWYRVGLDVWPVPGHESTSQEVASTLKSTLVLMHQ